MKVLNINIFSLFSEKEEGFGINTDIFETNVLNLAVVIGVLIYYGRSILADILKNRKETILKNLQDAENKFREAAENLSFAKNQFDIAKVKSEEIRSQGFAIADQSSKKLLASVEDDIKRLKESTLSTIRFEEEKSINEVVL